MFELFVRYVHFLGIIGVGSTLILEHVLLAWDSSSAKLKRLARVDMLFGICAAIVLSAGLCLWFCGTKPSLFYSHNWVFHLKLTLFALIGLLSIYPTIFFVKNRNKNPSDVEIPKVIIVLVRAELFVLLFIPLCAVFMARGYGFFNPS